MSDFSPILSPLQGVFGADFLSTLKLMFDDIRNSASILQTFNQRLQMTSVSHHPSHLTSGIPSSDSPSLPLSHSPSVEFSPFVLAKCVWFKSSSTSKATTGDMVGESEGERGMKGDEVGTGLGVGVVSGGGIVGGGGVIIPPFLQRYLDNFTSFYLETHRHREIKWRHDESIVTFSFHTSNPMRVGNVKRIRGTFFQYLILASIPPKDNVTLVSVIWFVSGMG